jgi:hypothetical protein
MFITGQYQSLHSGSVERADESLAMVSLENLLERPKQRHCRHVNSHIVFEEQGCSRRW